MSEQIELLKSTLTALGIPFVVDRLEMTGRDLLTIEDMNGLEVQFVFGRHGDVGEELKYWEVWKR